ncbi:ATP phosphoribosyltransferase regulatory subunit [Phenylobacterium sp.]|uniref:ATP phosphoribosyltransferase regulatory subunit n=1 Tax=Phenylobacterium sp. TaxID=1871053 RepID=UPI00286D7879|nr:ATP phosphoribosyltransferase regulatory subunit [Phenylobacterium sp.]
MRAEPRVPADVLANLRAPLSEGAAIVDAPILQPLGLLLELAGEAMRARLFVVQAEGGQETCLRPDFTVPVTRMHLESGATSGRYYYEGKAFRASPEHADRAEEFVQIGLERFDANGAPILEADAEIAALAWKSAVAGGRDDLLLWLGDIGLFAAFVDGLDLAPSLAARLKRAASRPRLLQAELSRVGGDAKPVEGGALADLLAGRSPDEAAVLLEEVWALAGIEPVGGRGPAEIAQRLIRRAEAARAPALSVDQAQSLARFLSISDTPAKALSAIRAIPGAKGEALSVALAQWEQRLALLTKAGAPESAMLMATTLGHAFEYYDGLTFEVRSTALGADRPVAVGGRYDGLPARLDGPANGRAVGCMVRPWRAFVGGEA